MSRCATPGTVPRIRCVASVPESIEGSILMERRTLRHLIGRACASIAKYFREFFLPDLPGADEIGKYSLIFKEAPPWLLWFTNADVEAYILGIELPGLSEVSCFARGKWLVEHLPPGPFELRPLPRLGDGTNLKTK